MFCVVEFTNKELSVVPYQWIYKKETKCRWPLTTGNSTFTNFMKRNLNPRKSWPGFKVIKVHFKSDDYSKAERELCELIRDGTTENELTGSSVQSFTKKSVPQVCSESSDKSSDESSEDTPNNAAKPKNVATVKENTATVTAGKLIASVASKTNLPNNPDQTVTVVEPMASTSTSVLEASMHGLGSASTVTISPEISEPLETSTPNTTLALDASFTFSEGFQNTVLNSLSRLTTLMDQHSILLNDIYRKTMNMDSTVKPPQNLPNFPLNGVENFDEFEKELQDSTELCEYMIIRLAAVGGSTLESHCRRMLQFLMTNNLAIKYNWKGRDKISFQKTKLMSIIYKAARKAFPNDGNLDYTTEQTVKQWLKYAKQRKNQ